ncbi:MAG: hypothetical protein JOZ18_09090 [Chloroflexi bacterium]|nr:hypothetical protein [Chloroflexota bacterium]
MVIYFNATLCFFYYSSGLTGLTALIGRVGWGSEASLDGGRGGRDQSRPYTREHCTDPAPYSFSHYLL